MFALTEKEREESEREKNASRASLLFTFKKSLMVVNLVKLPKVFPCKYCQKEFKHLTDKKRHEEDKCAIYGGVVDKRKKSLFDQAVEGSLKLDGTKMHTSAIFHGLLALPEEERNHITIDMVENEVIVKSQPAEEKTPIPPPAEPPLVPSNSPSATLSIQTDTVETKALNEARFYLLLYNSFVFYLLLYNCVFCSIIIVST